MDTIKVIVKEAPFYTRQKFFATVAEWDLGIPIGYGSSIQEALENFIESWEMKYNEHPKYLWS
jgi:hypothetical protein